jgi:uncharacterized protein (TIGR00251 family)
MSELRPFLEELQAAGQVTLNVKVVPKSAGNWIAGRMADGTLKVKVAAPPEKGKANAELRAFLAKQFGVPKANVTIRSGETSPRKRVRIVGTSRVSRTS